MILLILIGYVVAYAILLMMIIGFLCAVIISFAAYVVAYYAAYAWCAVRHRSTPEWRYRRKRLEVNQEKIQGFATGLGLFTMGLLVLGFFIYAGSESWSATLGWTGTIGALAALVSWDTVFNKRTPKDSTTLGDIRDRHSL